MANLVAGDDAELLTESALKHMSRRIKDYVPQEAVNQPFEDHINKAKAVLEKVFQAAEDVDVKTTHRVTAWNTLCAFVDASSESESHAIRSIVWDAGIWQRAFALYIDHSHNARPKSSKQLLATLSSSLRKADGPPAFKGVAKRLFEIIQSREDLHRTKSCLQVLAHFLSKKVLVLRDVLRDHAEIDGLITTLLLCAGKGDLGSVVGQALSVVLARAEEDPILSLSRALWARPLDVVVKSNAVGVEELRVHVLPVLFKRDLPDYVRFLHQIGLERLNPGTLGHRLQSESGQYIMNNELLYAALRCGKELGLLYDTGDSQISHTSSHILLPIRSIRRLLISSSRQARLTGLSLLITSHSATRPFPDAALKLLRRHLHVFFADTDANFRSEVFSLMQRLMDRLRAITAVLSRKTASVLDGDAIANDLAAGALQSHRLFLKWLLAFLSWGLRPTASYQRHICALRALVIVSRSGLDDAVGNGHQSKMAQTEAKWPFHLSVMTPELRRLLLDLIMDPFDDVRQTSASILTMYTTPRDQTNQVQIHGELLGALHRAEELMLSTGRADQADGVAHLYSLLYRQAIDTPLGTKVLPSSRQSIIMGLLDRLRRLLRIARSDIAAAVNKYHIHGLFTSLRYVLYQCEGELVTNKLLPALEACLHDVWEVVKPVLCNDAPEGYLPEDAGDISEVSTKDTLSYCWRALKESSLLLGVIVSKSSLHPESLLSLSNLCFTQLADLRHRGAFSTVAQTWVTCCSRVYEREFENSGSQLLSWYDQVLDILRSKTTINTRRSAGLPALLCGLLISDEHGVLISRAFRDLATIATEPVEAASTQAASLPQVHAMNCIKDILKNSRLGEQSERYVAQSLRLAASSLRSEAWAIQNCGLMLIRAVIDRLLGTSDAHPEGDATVPTRLAARQHPELLDVVVDLLVVPEATKDNISRSTNKGVFPALQLLPRMQVPDDQRSKSRQAVLALTASRSWHIRDKAARTYAAMVSGDDTDREIQRLLELNAQDLNALHGALLCVKYLIRNRQASSAPVTNDLAHRPEHGLSKTELPKYPSSAMASIKSIYYDTECALIKAACIDLLNESGQQRSSDASQAEEVRTLRRPIHAEIDICPELERALSSTDRGLGHSMLRTSLAYALGNKLSTTATTLDARDIDRIASLILSLGRTDADACCSLFASFCQTSEFPADCSSSAHILLQAASNILSGRCHIKLKCEVQQFLLYFTDRLLPQQQAEYSERVVETCIRALLPFSKESNQQYADQWLQLQALAFEQSLSIAADDAERQRLDIAGWVGQWCRTVEGESVFSREAAALSTKRLSATWQYLGHAYPRLFCELCFGIYDLLNDDDEAIRLLASSTAKQVVLCTSESTLDGTLEPITASQKLVRFMLQRWQQDRFFIEEAFQRAFKPSTASDISVSERLAAHGTFDTALFAEEKQNLYIDEAREVRVWSQVILKVHANSVPTSSVHRLASWVSAGLVALTEQFDYESDGPLGCTTEEDIFTLGLRVIYGAEVLLHLVESGVEIPIRPSTLRLQLGKLGMVADLVAINVLWRREIERLIAWAVNRKLQSCKMVMDEISTGPRKRFSP